MRFVLQGVNKMYVKKKLNTIFLIMVGLVMVVEARSQRYDLYLKNYRDSIRRVIFEVARKENIPLVKKITKIDVVPACHYTSAGFSFSGDEHRDVLPVIDSFSVYAVLEEDKKFAGVIENTGTGKYSFYSLEDLSFLNRRKFDNASYQMIRLAASYSKNYFFISFFTEERNRFAVIGFIVKGKTMYADRQLKVYKDLGSLVDAKYGNRQVFVDNMNKQLKGKKLQKQLTFEVARKLIADDYIRYTHDHPVDTNGIMRSFMKDLGNAVSLNDTLKKRLPVIIKEGLKEAPLYKQKQKGFRIPFLDRNIFPLLQQVLPGTDLDRYERYRENQKAMLKKAYEKVNTEDAENEWEKDEFFPAERIR